VSSLACPITIGHGGQGRTNRGVGFVVLGRVGKYDKALEHLQAIAGQLVGVLSGLEEGR
jgi:hypothetical protein